MSTVRKHSLTILVAIVVAIATFFVTDFLLPRAALAPGSSANNANSSLQSGNSAGSTSLGLPADSVIIPVSIVSVQENASTSPIISIEYPQFPSLSLDFNAAIASATKSRLAQFQSDVAGSQSARAATAAEYPGAAISPNAYDFIATWQVAQINSRYVSFVMNFEWFSGGANENEDVQTFNYDSMQRETLSLADLFTNVPDYLNQISQIARRNLIDTLTAASKGNTPTDMIDAGTAPSADNFSNFTFTDNAVTLYFPKYAVAPGSFGEQQVTIPRDSVK